MKGKNILLKHSETSNIILEKVDLIYKQVFNSVTEETK